VREQVFFPCGKELGLCAHFIGGDKGKLRGGKARSGEKSSLQLKKFY